MYQHHLCRGGAATSSMMMIFIVCHDEVCVLLGRVFGFNHKIMIKVQELPSSIMDIRNLWSVRV
jgi:hypothetical protein